MNDTTHPAEQDLILHYYGEADDPAAVEAHFKACATCRAAFESLQSTLNAIEAPEVPWRPESYGADVFARLEPNIRNRRIAKSPNRQIAKSPNRQMWWWPFRWSPAKQLAFAGASIALPLIGFLVGLRWSTPPHRPAGEPPRPGLVTEAVSPERVRERVLLITVGDHLERSQMALVELVNAEGARTIDISSEKTWVEDLLAANRLYRQTASEEGNTGVADLLDELERVLVEIAHSPSTISASQLDRLRGRIEEGGILFKVRVLGNRIREDAQRPLTQPTS